LSPYKQVKRSQGGKINSGSPSLKGGRPGGEKQQGVYEHALGIRGSGVATWKSSRETLEDENG